MYVGGGGEGCVCGGGGGGGAVNGAVYARVVSTACPLHLRGGSTVEGSLERWTNSGGLTREVDQ